MNYNRAKRPTYLANRNILILVVIVSLVSIFLTPMSELKQNLSDDLPWVGLGTLITEGLFIIGLGIMALEAGHELGKNPLTWRKKLHHIVSQIVKTRLFWVGFWINTAGAVGTAVILAIGIFKTLPPQSWGLLWLPIADLGFTLALRSAAISAIREPK